jgi:metal-responsive CopG/Arc/MetJ family transcriptional regulator
MGRPPLNHVRVHVSLPQDALDAIDERVGTYGRAKFVREAVEEKLARDKA